MKDILTIGALLYGSIYMILWYKGKLNLTGKKRERREAVLREHDVLLRGLIALILLGTIFVITIKALAVLGYIRI
jgi:hypothetical protein